MNAFCVTPSDDLGCRSLGLPGPVRAYNGQSPLYDRYRKVKLVDPVGGVHRR
ncbi:hypothetical protein COCCADRAFT_107099 [Bipolaris zeicola 26-R-13]|uniref:Uncharacterized protein n=1 Tax=Cochliobolus carbonum (strain 26-R-13) TaxID=930089 RepID=W6XPG3_COCC2|nr:uncharacterized protein COCCADRAFT_107099 [Bipolaris zeicola 26-R-13]EUC29227.1 hypothetical protein COCCADRAFT_107099 [Bipolaris zeicola 26-R-13]